MAETTYSYNAADQLTETDGPGGTVEYTYDANGNLVDNGTRSFVFDLADRPISTTEDMQTTTYSYDGDGKRLQAAGEGIVKLPLGRKCCPTASRGRARRRGHAPTTLRLRPEPCVHEHGR